MSEMFNKILERVGQSIFCYSKSGGEGFAFKAECECYCNNTLDCQAYKDMKDFHSNFKGIPTEKLPFYRQRIIDEIRDEFKDSQWWKDNVVE